MNYGINKRVMRDKLPLQVLVGNYPTEPTKLSFLAPSIDDEAIKEGMVLKIATGDVNGIAGQTGFKKAEAADATTDVAFYIARHDGDSHDVQASGKLVGLDCSDTFEMKTGYFTAAGPIAIGDPLTVGDDGVLVPTTTAGDRIVGYVTAVGTGTNNAIAYSGKTPTATDTLMIQFKTAQNGQVVA